MSLVAFGMYKAVYLARLCQRKKYNAFPYSSLPAANLVAIATVFVVGRAYLNIYAYLCTANLVVIATKFAA